MAMMDEIRQEKLDTISMKSFDCFSQSEAIISALMDKRGNQMASTQPLVKSAKAASDSKTKKVVNH